MEQEQFNIDWEKLEAILEKPEQERVSLIAPLLPEERKALEQLQQLRGDALFTGALQLDTQQAWKKTFGAIGKTSIKPVWNFRHQWRRWVAAACLLILAGAAWLLWRDRPAGIMREQSIQEGLAGHIPSSKIQLITASGKTIEVDSLQQFREKDGTSIHMQEGTMTYHQAGASHTPGIDTTAGALMNTLIVPRGYLQSLVLSDGTKVWLNADSRIIFPVRFDKKERRVSIQGEAYFEVKPGAQQPFIVSVHTSGHTVQNTSPDAEVQVLGTSFNVKAYGNTIYTTLATGSVLFRPSTGRSVQLSPDHQVMYNTQSGTNILQNVSAVDHTAWRNDELVMNKMTMAELAELLERRYDVQISFSDESLKHIQYNAALHLTPQVADMLENLEQTGLVRFAVRDRKITVMPYEK